MKDKIHFLLFVPVFLVYLSGMFIDVMEVDAAQYAAMSREMHDTGNYLEIYDRGSDYLDKPPLLFWLSALSFKLFGIANFTYRLPSILFSLLGLLSTYKLAKALYSDRTGFYAALILSTCQAWFLMNHDIRTDTILAACTIFSLWQLHLFAQHNRFLNLILGALGIAGAMLTKGPIGLMVPALAIGFNLIVKRDWKTFFNWRWLLIPVIVLVVLSPMLVGLYKQYDLQPGKLIHNVPIQSGLQFYFWTQSFGRITGESVWKDHSTPLFFTHTFLWAFLPWCLLFLVGFWKSTKRLIISKLKLAKREEAITWGGFVFPFIAFSLSHYKLPHYIFVLFPLAAIITGRYLECLLRDRQKSFRLNVLRETQFVISLILYALVFMLCFFSFPMQSVLSWALYIVSLGLSVYLSRKGKTNFQRVVLPSFIAVIVLNFLLNTHFYPSLFHYAASNQAARILKASPDGVDNLVAYQENMYGLDFYSRQCIPVYEKLPDLIERCKVGRCWIFTGSTGYTEIKQSKLKITEERKLEHFHVSRLSAKFLNPATRTKQLDSRYLIKVDFRNE